ncbi:hypothetical protein SCA6_003043 [Theobroma cacao]
MTIAMLKIYALSPPYLANNVKFPRDSWTHMNASCPYLWLREVAYANVYTSLVIGLRRSEQVLRVLNLPMMPFLAKEYGGAAFFL